MSRNRDRLLGLLDLGFDVRKKIGGDGREIVPDENNFHDEMLSKGNDVEIEVKVRSAPHENMFRKEWEGADKSMRPVKPRGRNKGFLFQVDWYMVP
jgi:hypothetical protein